ncbi:MAG: type II and III secretion system protein family protein [Mariniblastus sp.]
MNPLRNHVTKTLTLALIAFVLVSVLVEAISHAQILARPGDQSKTALEKPASYSAEKERALIREILEPELILRLEPGQSKIVRTNYPVQRTAISHPSVVDVQVFDPTEIEIIGKDLGEATLTFWFQVPNGRIHVLRYHVKVDNQKEKARQREARNKELQSRINELFPNSQVFLFPIEDKVIVRGQARDSKEASDIMQMLGQSGGRRGRGRGSGGSGFGDFGTGGFGPRGGGNQFQAGLNSNPDTPANSTGGNDSGSSNFINMLHVPGEQQVMLKVRIAELTRNSSRSAGADLSMMFDSTQLSHLISGGGNLTAILEDGDVRFLLKAIASHGYGKILAEPTLTTISGKPARFLAGGEFAVPTTVGIGGVGAASTAFRGFGTELSFTPTVTDKDLVRLEVSPSFSSINADATVGGIPGLNRRSVDTTVDLREGQWLAIAGLIQDEQGGQRRRLPFVGDLPLLGGFFGSQDTSRFETELIVLVSPELVHPMEASQLPLLLPGMEITDPTDDDFFVRHQTEGYRGFDYRSTVWPEQTSQNAGLKRESLSKRLKQGPSRRLRTQRVYVSGDSGFSK